MTTPLDWQDPVTTVRGLIPDLEKLINSNRPDDPAEYIFSDQHLTSLLALNNGRPRLAAADALEILGTSEALILKVITTEDLATDGAKAMAQYLQRARQMRQLDASEVSETEGDFVVVDFYVEPPQLEWR